MNVRSHAGRAALALAIALWGSAVPGTALAQQLPDPLVQQVAARQPEVYFLRGFADVFSAGLDQMGTSLRARGVDAHVQGHISWGEVANKIIEDRARGLRGPVILVGHSLGANAIIKIAERLRQHGIKVDLLITLAATAPAPLPANVRRAVNYYFETHGWGEPLVAGPGFRGTLRNKDYSNIAEVGHFNIDKQRAVQVEILNLVARAAR